MKGKMRYIAMHLHQFQSDLGKIEMDDHLLSRYYYTHVSPQKLNNTPVLPDTRDLRYVLACQHFS